MVSEKLCKTVHQYNKYPIPQEDMQKLMEIAEDYRAVRNEVYQRYGGIKSLGKLYPGFTVQKEMAKTGLREQRKMPSVYFNIAVLDAVSDIKNQWNRTKERVSKGIHKHPNFNAEEKHYLRLVLKIPNIFDAVLNRQAVTGLKKDIQKKYDEIAAKVDRNKLFAGQAPEVFRFDLYYDANKNLLPDRLYQVNGSTEPAILAGMLGER